MKKLLSRRALILSTLTLLASAGIAFAAVCAACNGSGTGAFPCGTCKGTGLYNGNKCTFCGGKGFPKCNSCNGSGQK